MVQVGNKVRTVVQAENEVRTAIQSESQIKTEQSREDVEDDLERSRQRGRSEQNF